MTRRTPEEYNWNELEFDETVLSEIDGYPRRWSSREGSRIGFVVVHHMAMIGKGAGAANDACVRAWRTRKASAHYGVDGKNVRQFVWDSDMAWAVGNLSANRRSISIEHANSSASPEWRVSETTWKNGARLVGYLCWKYAIGRPKAGTTLRRHKDFADTACPGPFLGGSNWDEYEREAQKVYDALVGEPAAEPTTTPTSGLLEYPADLFGPGWKLTTPELYSGHAREIRQPELARYSSRWCRLSSNRKSVLFTANHGGATTEGSRNVRSELREMTPDGRREIFWDGRRGRHKLGNLELAVNRLTPVKPHDVLAQVHNGRDDLTTLRVEGIKKSGELTDEMLVFVTEGNDSHAFQVGKIKRTQRFSFGFDVVDGEIGYLWNDRPLDFSVEATDDCFYKLGNYLQSNPSTAPKESKSSTSEVRLFTRPKVSHA